MILRRGAECGNEAPYELVERMRASIVVLGPLLGRTGRARVAMPGGDDFGSRPIDMHLAGLEQMGATFEFRHGYIEARADQLLGARIVLEFPSVGATENLLLAAVLAKGTTVIENAAREPEIADLAAFLNTMGALVVGAGSSTITVEGVEELEPADHTVIPDRIEAATYLAARGPGGRGDHHRRGPARPHGHVHPEARGHGGAHRPEQQRPVGVADPAPQVGGRFHPAVSRGSPRTTSRCSSPCSAWPTAWRS